MVVIVMTTVGDAVVVAGDAVGGGVINNSISRVYFVFTHPAHTSSDGDEAILSDLSSRTI